MDVLKTYSGSTPSSSSSSSSHEKSTHVSKANAHENLSKMITNTCDEIALLVSTKNSAPDVTVRLPTDSLALENPGWKGGQFLDPSAKYLPYNPTFEAMWAPLQGPSRNCASLASNITSRNVTTGFIEAQHMSDAAFESQFHAFEATRKAQDPATGAEIRANAQLSTLGGKAKETDMYLKEHDEVLLTPLERQKRAQEKALAAKAKKRRREEGQGLAHQPRVEDRRIGLPIPADSAADISTLDSNQNAVAPTSILHTGKATDYQGRSFIDPPPGVKGAKDLENITSYIPKKCIHTWSGHTKGVSAIRFFPEYGHLLLSASMDATVKLWDVHDKRKCIRTYSGHAKSVRDICFTNDGRGFLSASIDRTVKLWDTETGKFISSFTNKAIPYCIKFNPEEDKQNEFLAGGSDKKIIQYDIRSSEIVQEYDQHLGAVNTIAFIDQNRRFATSSDDKTIRLWEYGIPVVIKYIAEPEMHSMPAVSIHPSSKYACYQSLDNQIVTYDIKDKFKLNRKKAFKGHLNAGYACGLSFSPDGRFLSSGDAQGRLFFWDWKTKKIFRALKGHEGVSIGIEWHPTETSKVATCGWDGLIKYWD